ncbi:LIC_10461 domain-containing protein [Leptospira sp. GIMC2001]|uniref:LIC_10461 domain-containing protein n=1 Tax=Leptospira sp. GIMC2001 TaxID=1513297 RepID=UPI003FA5BF2E
MRLVTLLIFATLLQCNRTTINFQKSPKDQNLQESSLKTYSYVIGYLELGQTKTTNCDSSKLSRVVMERNWLDTVIHFAIGGFVTTRTTTVTCIK